MIFYCTQLLQCERDEDVQELLCCDQGLDVLNSICFRGVPQNALHKAEKKLR